MEPLIQLLATYGLWAVFLSVLIEQGGIPLPAWPIILVASAQAVERNESLWPILLAATFASLIADLVWYQAGRRFGASMLRLICRVSLSPDTCISDTRSLFLKWGPPSLLFAKFIPGFAAVGTTLAGFERTRISRFVLFDGLGAALWAGLALAVGAIFHDAVNDALEALASVGRTGVAVVVLALLVFLGRKVWMRQKLIRQLRMDRVSVDELSGMLAEAERPLLVDVRPDDLRVRTGWIPGAIVLAEIAELGSQELHEVVVYCDCPNEVSAAKVAQQLKQLGFRRVRPLTGGMSAWLARGLPVAMA